MTVHNNAAERDGNQSRFLPVTVDSLDYCTLEMDLYLRTSAAGDPTLHRAAGVAFTQRDARRLLDQGISTLCISIDHHAAYRRMLLQKLDARVRAPHLAHQDRWKTVRASCDQMIKDVLLLPGQVETIEAIADIGRAFAEWSRDEACGFSYMFDMSAHDYSITGHMVNVGVGCGLLAREHKPDDAVLFSVLVQGGMLHDVGKRGIPERILNKEGKLDPDEWALVQKHPSLGFDELRQHPTLPPVVPQMARDHHERVDGKGYPHGLAAKDICFAARVCAVVDVYDAITAVRPYRGAVAPADALDIMREGRGSQFDSDILDTWTRLVKRLIAEDPRRAVNASASGAVRPLCEAQARPFASTPNINPDDLPLDDLANNRRRHDRTPYNVTLSAAFVRQGKHLPINVGQTFAVNGVDISRSGVAVETPWPLSLGDVLWIQFPTKDGRTVTRYAKVARVRRGRDEQWIAGCGFIEQSAIAA